MFEGGFSLRRILLLFLSCAVLVFAIGCEKKEQGISSDSDDGEKIRAGFVYIGYIGDSGWTFTHEQGREAMNKLPFVKKSTYLEAVPVGADTVRTLTGLVNQGHNLIFANSFGYMDAMVEVAGKFPEVTFMHCAGYKVGPNLGTYFGRIEEARYLTGVLAGRMTKKNIIGYVAAYPIPEVVRGINAFTLGVRSVNPNAQVRVVWTNTWYDPATERSAAESLINVGADILTMHQDTPAVIQAANDKNIMSIGYNSDMSKYAPENLLTSAIWNWAPFYDFIANSVHDGTWESEQIMWGMKEGIIDLAPFGPKVPSELAEEINKLKSDIIEGKLSYFKGPIVDQNGKIRIEAGRTATIEEELNMDYFVKGVKGSLK